VKLSDPKHFEIDRETRSLVLDNSDNGAMKMKMKMKMKRNSHPSVKVSACYFYLPATPLKVKREIF
jgi:hypothetical protein